MRSNIIAETFILVSALIVWLYIAQVVTGINIHSSLTKKRVVLPVSTWDCDLTTSARKLKSCKADKRCCLIKDSADLKNNRNLNK